MTGIAQGNGVFAKINTNCKLCSIATRSPKKFTERCGMLCRNHGRRPTVFCFLPEVHHTAGYSDNRKNKTYAVVSRRVYLYWRNQSESRLSQKCEGHP